MPPRYSPTDAPPADADDARTAAPAGRRSKRMLTVALAMAVVVLVAGGLRSRRR